MQVHVKVLLPTEKVSKQFLFYYFFKQQVFFFHLLIYITFYLQLSPEYTLCTECLGLLENRVNMGEETFSTLPALGHRSICFPCGKSILRAQRTYPVHRNREESNILTRLVPLHLVRVFVNLFNVPIKMILADENHI